MYHDIWNTQVSILSNVYLSCNRKIKKNRFLRLCLPVFLQQYLRCKVWDDTAKIKYIALFAISEQCSIKWNNSLLTTELIQSNLNSKLFRSTSTTSIPHAHLRHQLKSRNLAPSPKHVKSSKYQVSNRRWYIAGQKPKLKKDHREILIQCSHSNH